MADATSHVLNPERLEQIASRMLTGSAEVGTLAAAVAHLLPAIKASRRNKASWRHIAESLTAGGIIASPDAVRMAYRRAIATKPGGRLLAMRPQLPTSQAMPPPVQALPMAPPRAQDDRPKPGGPSLARRAR